MGLCLGLISIATIRPRREGNRRVIGGGDLLARSREVIFRLITVHGVVEKTLLCPETLTGGGGTQLYPAGGLVVGSCQIHLIDLKRMTKRP